MIRSILFDLDGTLLDTLDDLANSVNYALRTHHLPERSHTEIRSFLGNGIRNLMLDAVGRGMSDEAFEPVFQTFRTYYVKHCLDKSKPFAGIIDLLKALQQRGITMAVVSNKLHPAVVELNERFFKDYITSAVGESATVRRKPNPDAVLAALSDVGDSEVDLHTAQNAGMQCMLVLWGFRDEDFLRSLPGASLFAQCPADILSWLDTQC